MSQELKEQVTNDETVAKPQKKKSVYGKVINCNLLNVREEPSLRANVIDKISVGQKVRIVGESDNNFYKVFVNNKNGYCVKNYIEVTANEQQK